MRYKEILESCWTGYRQAGMKKKGDRMVPNCVPVSEEQMEEDLRKWFKEKWVRFGPDGKIRGACARGNKSEGKPKCLPQSKAHALGKKGRASAAAKKRREDPNPERRGPAKNVATKVKEQGVAEGKIKLSTDPNWYGAEVGNYKASGPIVNIPADRLVGFEPDDKMNQSASKTNVEKIVAGLKQGAKLPPLLVRQYENGYQVLDGHHRFWAYKLLGVKSIPAQVVPAKDIKEITKQGVAEMDKSQTPPARHGDYPLGAKGTKAKPVSAKKVVKDLVRDLDKAFSKEKGVSEVKKPAPRTRGEFVPAGNSSDSYKAGYDLGIKLVRAANMTQAAKTQVVQTQSQQQAMPADFIKGYKKGFSDVAGYIRNQQDIANAANKTYQNPEWRSITPDQVQQIVTRYSAGETSPQIAPDFGLDAQQILRLIDKQANRDEIIRLNRQNRKGKIGPQRQLAFDEAQTDYQKRRQRERDVDMGRPVKPLPKNPKTDYQKRREQERREQDLGEAEAKTMYRVIFNGRPIDMLFATLQQAQMVAAKLEQKHGGKARVDHTVDVPKELDEKQDACYRKVKSRYKVWPSAYASGALVQCRKKGAANWGNKTKK